MCWSVSIPSMELGCGLGVTLVLMLLLFVLYHVFWLELLLLYRSWFGTDERHSGKQLPQFKPWQSIFYGSDLPADVKLLTIDQMT